MPDVEGVQTIGVVGAGTMGSGIAQVAAMAGYGVIMRDVERGFVDDGFARIKESLDRLVEGDRLDRESADAAFDRIVGTTDLDDLAGTDFVIEAIVEDLETKREVFAELDAIVEEGIPLASNTSTLSITSLASATDRPSLVVGMHFMNPAPIMDGVEIVVGERTDADTVEFARELAEDFGKTPWVADDKPGFLVNRILMPWINEGVRAYDEGVADRDAIDAAMRLGTNVPMGPLELADQIGLDVVLQATETLRDELGDRYAPAYLLKRKVAAGHLGRKSGRGFYDYSSDSEADEAERSSQ